MNHFNAINQLNTSTVDHVESLLMQCCTSSLWVKLLVSEIPFTDYDNLVNVANNVWKGLSESDYLEAFEGHPKIGDVNSLREKYVTTKALATGEQASINTAPDNVLEALAHGNYVYEKKFGFIFIVCATGKSAAEMLKLLEQRYTNNRNVELVNAIEEQRKIFQIRIIKMLESLHE